MPNRQPRIKKAGDRNLAKGELLAFVYRNPGVRSRDVADMHVKPETGTLHTPHFRDYCELGEQLLPCAGRKRCKQPLGPCQCKGSQWRRYQSNGFNLMNELAKAGQLIKTGNRGNMRFYPK